MALASPVFQAMFKGGSAETRDYITIVDVEPEIFKAMLRYSRRKPKSCYKRAALRMAALTTVKKIFSQNVLNINRELDLMNADASVMNVEQSSKALVEKQNSTDGPEQASPGSSHQTNDTVNKQQIRSVVKHIRFLTLTPRCSLLTLAEDHAVLVNLVSNEPNGLFTSTIRRNMVYNARSEATFRYTVQNINSLEDREYSPVFYVRNLPCRIAAKSTVSAVKKYLDLGVECSAEGKSKNWSCKANIEFRLICHRPGAEDLVARK